jgi:integrase
VHQQFLREPDVEAFLTHLAVDRRLGASSQRQALCALAFLYRAVLRNPLGRLEAVRAERPDRVPTVLSVDEVKRVLAVLDRHPTHGLIGRLPYGAGLRVGEGCTLRLMDLDFDRRQNVVRSAKGFKDRVVPELRRQLDRVRAVHARAATKGPEWGWAPVPAAVAHKRPAAGREPGWQYLFPSAVTAPNRSTARRSSATRSKPPPRMPA